MPKIIRTPAFDNLESNRIPQLSPFQVRAEKKPYNYLILNAFNMQWEPLPIAAGSNHSRNVHKYDLFFLALRGRGYYLWIKAEGMNA